MTRDVSISTILGLNNRLTLTRMDAAVSNSASASWLRTADNIDLCTNGFLRRRLGFSAAASGDWHSLWSDPLGAYAVNNGDLVHLSEDLTQTIVLSGVGGTRMSYARLPDGMVYWTNGPKIGRIDGTTPREVSTPVPNPAPVASASGGGLRPGRYQVCFTSIGPEGESGSTEPVQFQFGVYGGIEFTGLGPDTLVYVTGPDGDVFNEIVGGSYQSPSNDGAACDTFMLKSMPAGQALAHHRGSLLVARGPWLHISEAYRYGLYNAGRGFIPFPAPISVVQPCEDGVYICADKTYWLPGDPLTSSPTVVLPYGALPGSSMFDPEEQVAYWQGQQGAVVARPGGMVTAPQNTALTFPAAENGFTWVRRQLGDKHLITSRFGVATP